MSFDADDPASTTDEGPVETEEGSETTPPTDAAETPRETVETGEPPETAFVWHQSGPGGVTDRTTGATEETTGEAEETTGSNVEPPTSTETTDTDGQPRLAPGRYLFAGETIVEHHETRAGWVAVTTHRLLTFDPDADGKRFETVNRPNVVAVRTTDGGNPTLHAYRWRALGYAVVLLGGGLVARSMGLQSLFRTPTATGTGTVGIDGLLSALSLFGLVVGLLVDLLLVAGVVAALAALGLAAWSLLARRPTLVVERAGEADIELELPTEAAGRRTVDALERALRDELAVGRS